MPHTKILSLVKRKRKNNATIQEPHSVFMASNVPVLLGVYNNNDIHYLTLPASLIPRSSFLSLGPVPEEVGQGYEIM